MEKLCRRGLRVLQALFDLDSLLGLDGFTKDHRILHRRIKGLVTTPLVVVDILANDPPVVRPEDLLAEDLIGVVQAVEDEPTSASSGHCAAYVRETQF